MRKERLPNGHSHLASTSAACHAPASTIPDKGGVQVHVQDCPKPATTLSGIGNMRRGCSTSTPIRRQHQPLAIRQFQRTQARAKFKSTYKTAQDPPHRQTRSRTQEAAQPPHPSHTFDNRMHRAEVPRLERCSNHGEPTPLTLVSRCGGLFCLF